MSHFFTHPPFSNFILIKIQYLFDLNTLSRKRKVNKISYILTYPILGG